MVKQRKKLDHHPHVSDKVLSDILMGNYVR